MKFVCPRMSLRMLFQPVICIFLLIKTLNCWVAASKLHEHEEGHVALALLSGPNCSFAILCHWLNQPPKETAHVQKYQSGQTKVRQALKLQNTLDT